MQQTSDFHFIHSYFEATSHLAALSSLKKRKDALYLKTSYFVIHCGTSYLMTELQRQKDKSKTSLVTGLYALPAILQALLLALMIGAAQHCDVFAFKGVCCFQPHRQQHKLLLIGAQNIFFMQLFFAPFAGIFECLVKCPL